MRCPLDAPGPSFSSCHVGDPNFTWDHLCGGREWRPRETARFLGLAARGRAGPGRAGPAPSPRRPRRRPHVPPEDSRLIKAASTFLAAPGGGAAGVGAAAPADVPGGRNGLLGAGHPSATGAGGGSGGGVRHLAPPPPPPCRLSRR
ncbi:mitogen-activated protein kinase kinase kinase 12-like [Schistocerca serialis cubense]|uniref:mitogen-activated protein kinase kinase kinase 12-like n=1 Tax=Schistocerca serialis cubense TaxID=2023355 RepID=UPI00214E74E0|nr:mitogen-activated protein kinase kinase kinase 12-like [Schistocerca serialis cubense]